MKHGISKYISSIFKYNFQTKLPEKDIYQGFRFKKIHFSSIVLSILNGFKIAVHSLSSCRSLSRSSFWRTCGNKMQHK